MICGIFQGLPREKTNALSTSSAPPLSAVQVQTCTASSPTSRRYRMHAEFVNPKMWRSCRKSSRGTAAVDAVRYRSIKGSCAASRTEAWIESEPIAVRRSTALSYFSKVRLKSIGDWVRLSTSIKRSTNGSNEAALQTMSIDLILPASQISSQDGGGTKESI